MPEMSVLDSLYFSTDTVAMMGYGDATLRSALGGARVARPSAVPVVTRVFDRSLAAIIAREFSFADPQSAEELTALTSSGLHLGTRARR